MIAFLLLLGGISPLLYDLGYSEAPNFGNAKLRQGEIELVGNTFIGYTINCIMISISMWKNLL